MTAIYFAGLLFATSPPRVSRTPAAVTLTEMEATLHFSGLVLFTRRDVGEPPTLMAGPVSSKNRQLFAIMPSVKHFNPTVTTETSVEDHTAVIAFSPCHLLSVSGWEVKQLRTDLLYIELAGDRIHFVADGPNTPAPFTWGLPRVKNGTQLRPEFQTAPGAAAVFEIPVAKSITGCLAGTADTRVDTEMTLLNFGKITIAGDGGKSVTFVGEAKVYLANMPMAWLINKTISGGDESHNVVYCEMTGATQCESPTTSTVTNVCGDSTFLMRPPSGTTRGQTERHAGHDTTQTADIFCSNTSWP